MENYQYQKMSKLEKTHWWFCGRRAIIKDIIIKYSKKINIILEVGSGTGGNLEMLSLFGKVKSFETNLKALEISKKGNNKNIETIYGSCPDEIPFEYEKFDLICMLDVLEHIKEDKTTLEKLSKKLSKEGLLIITVPAYQWLWSEHDKVNHHFRRYNKKAIIKIIKNNYKVLKISYFNFFLFPIALIFRILDIVKSKYNEDATNQPGRIINSILRLIFLSEKYLLRFSNLPFGLSILIVLKKRESNQLK